MIRHFIFTLSLSLIFFFFILRARNQVSQLSPIFERHSARGLSFSWHYAFSFIFTVQCFFVCFFLKSRKQIRRKKERKELEILPLFRLPEMTYSWRNAVKAANRKKRRAIYNNVQYRIPSTHFFSPFPSFNVRLCCELFTSTLLTSCRP